MPHIQIMITVKADKHWQPHEITGNWDTDMEYSEMSASEIPATLASLARLGAVSAMAQWQDKEAQRAAEALQAELDTPKEE